MVASVPTCMLQPSNLKIRNIQQWLGIREATVKIHEIHRWWSTSCIKLFLPLNISPCLFVKQKVWKTHGDTHTHKKFQGPLPWFYVFWHLQLAPGCCLTLRNRCCPSVCHRLFFLSLQGRVCALVNSVCMLCSCVYPFSAVGFLCNEGMTTCLHGLTVNYSPVYCMCGSLCRKTVGWWERVSQG